MVAHRLFPRPCDVAEILGVPGAGGARAMFGEGLLAAPGRPLPVRVR